MIDPSSLHLWCISMSFPFTFSSDIKDFCLSHTVINRIQPAVQCKSGQLFRWIKSGKMRSKHAIYFTQMILCISEWYGIFNETTWNMELNWKFIESEKKWSLQTRMKPGWKIWDARHKGKIFKASFSIFINAYKNKNKLFGITCTFSPNIQEFYLSQTQLHTGYNLQWNVNLVSHLNINI